jgi:hypothetical protein
MNLSKRILSLIFVLLLFVSLFSGCDSFESDKVLDTTTQSTELSSISIINGGRLKLEVGNTIQLEHDIPEEYTQDVRWEVSNSSATVSNTGLVSALDAGTVAVTVTWNGVGDTALIEIVAPSPDYDDSEKDDFYEDYSPADSYSEAIERSKNGVLSGSLTVPDQEPTLSEYQPKKDGLFVKNNDPYYIDNNTYVVVDAYGNEVMRIYRGGGYITLEEVAAYVYAFGDVPANYISSKNMEPESSIWGEYLRLNHSKFSGNTKKYPYEPVLPDISGCGGDLQYYEIDIGTTGTDCDPKYIAKIYNDGHSITRGAARIVYARFDENGNKIIDPEEKYVFYTYNHYNDFQEYLNYYGGWGEMFGNITGGGKISSKTDYNPTPYVPVVPASLTDESLCVNNTFIYAWVDKRAFELLMTA